MSLLPSRGPASSLSTSPRSASTTATSTSARVHTAATCRRSSAWKVRGPSPVRASVSPGFRRRGATPSRSWSMRNAPFRSPTGSATRSGLPHCYRESPPTISARPRMGVQAGETVLVHAAAGGVGQLLTQMVTRRGGRVIATTSTEGKAELARAAGAAEVIAYEGFADRVKELTGGVGADVVYDGVGAATF